jgi:hypothetical protein
LGLSRRRVGPVLVAVASDCSKGTWRWAAGLPLSWLAVWASGSRSSMPIVVLGIVGV